MNIFLFILAQLANAGFCVASVFWWVRFDAGEFAANPSNDSYYEVFHRQRGTWRAGTHAFVALLCALPAALWHPAQLFGLHLQLPHLRGAYWLNFAALMCFALAYWLRTFNPQLNVRRGLAYVRRFYISFAVRAARFPDRFIADRARRRFPNDEAKAIEWAEKTNQLVLNCILFGGIFVYVVLLYFTIACCRK